MAQLNFTFESAFRIVKTEYIEIMSAGDSAGSNWNYEHSPLHESQIAQITLDWYSQHNFLTDWEYEPEYDEITDKITGYYSHHAEELKQFVKDELSVTPPKYKFE